MFSFRLIFCFNSHRKLINFCVLQCMSEVKDQGELLASLTKLKEKKKKQNVSVFNKYFFFYIFNKIIKLLNVLGSLITVDLF